MEKTDLVAYARECASKGQNLYAKFDLQEAQSLSAEDFQREVQRSWKKKALKYHPDKAKDNYDERLWQSFEKARDVLVDEAARAAYDSMIQAALRKRHERDQMSAKRRQMIDELERAERAAQDKKPRTGEEPESATVQAERRAMAERGRKKMEERQRLMREAEERERVREQAGTAAASSRQDPSPTAGGGDVVSDDLDAREAELERRIRENRERKAHKQLRKEERRARKNGAPSAASGEAEEKPSTTFNPQTLPLQRDSTEAYVKKNSLPTPTPSAASAPQQQGSLMERLRAAQVKREAEKRRKAEEEAMLESNIETN